MKNTPSIAVPLIFFLIFTICIVPKSMEAADTIQFIEKFALAEDREKALEELIPGTQDYYYFHALHYQNEQQWDRLAAIMEPWVKRYGENRQVREIRHREALIRYPENNKKTLDYLKRHLGLRFDHQQQKIDAKPDLPVRLDQNLITREAFLTDAFRQSRQLDHVKDSGLDWILRENIDLDGPRRRHLLQRLEYPDYERLTGLIAADLRTRESRGFGEFPIHGKLLPDQLEALEKIRSELKNDTRFIYTKISKLHPGADTNWKKDREVREQYLTRVWDYVKTLDSSHNSLKGHILFQLLLHHRETGNYPDGLWLTYLKLPRSVDYMEPGYVRNSRDQMDMNADFRDLTGCPPVVNDTRFVREYLLQKLADDGSYQDYTTFIKDTWLKQIFAEAKLTSGKGDAESWYSLLNPSEVQELKDRVDIEFAPTNREQFDPGDDVVLQVALKNVSDLVVKVYELNTLNFYQDKKTEINTDFDLDGLIPNEQFRHSYTEKPVIRKQHSFDFKSLNDKRGVWIIEFIGNGVSSRALIRKGQLQYISRNTPAGTMVTVLDEANHRVENAAVHFGGKKYTPEESGDVLLPFSRSGNQSIILSDGDFAALDEISLPAENYHLNAGFHVERETLLPGVEATVAIRPNLNCAGVPTTVALLEETKLLIRSTDLDDVTSVHEVEGIELFNDKETIHTFRVPRRVRMLEFVLSAKIPQVSNGGSKVHVSANRTFELNAIDETPLIADLHLAKIDGEYIIEVLGKTGEPLADRGVNLKLEHDNFSNALHISLKSDENGRVYAGRLDGIESITANGNGFERRTWHLDDNYTYTASTIHSAAGKPVQIATSKNTADGFSIFEVRKGTFVANHTAKGAVKDNILEINELEPGDYEVYLRDESRKIHLHIAKSDQSTAGWILSDHRHLQAGDPTPLQIAAVEPGDKEISIQLKNASASTRVHLFATKYLPEFPVYQSLGSGFGDTLSRIGRGGYESRYLSGRDIGEEYRYIIERRSRKTFPGNMTKRPALILNPWALRDTGTSVDDAEEGDAYKKAKASSRSSRSKPKPAAPAMAPVVVQDNSPNLDFLPSAAPVLLNLQPDENGKLTIPLEQIGGRQHIHVVAIDISGFAYRQISLPENQPLKHQDLRLSTALNPEEHFTQRRRVTTLEKGKSLKIADVRASDLETYDTLSSVFSVLSGISEDADQLGEFSFILNWPGLNEDKKRELYSKYACHELSFFLSRRDNDFFTTIIKPYLANKKDKTFIDHYLLGNDLAEFLQPWKYSRLNIVEKILLGRRIGGDENEAMQRAVSDWFSLLPSDPATASQFYRSAIRGRRLAGRTMDNLNRAVSAGGLVYDYAPEPSAAPPQQMGRGMAAADSFGLESEVEEVGAVSLGLPESVDEFRALRERSLSQALYRKLDTTKEWAENNYYHLPIEKQVESLITINDFWKAYAQWDGKGGFYSRHFPAASGNFAEAMLALSVLDLPFEAPKPETKIEEQSLTLTANSPLIVFHEEIEQTQPGEEKTDILISQNFFRADDRYTMENGERTDKFVTGEFLTATLYGCQVVITNPTSSGQKLDLLFQLPTGAVPVSETDYTKTHPIHLQPFRTETFEAYFYFPEPSADDGFAHYPVHIAKNEIPVAWAEPFRFTVVDELSDRDKASWDYISQYGSSAEVLTYLETNNVHFLDLSKIAWRMKSDVEFFRQTTDLLRDRKAWANDLWSYAIHHNSVDEIREYMAHQESFLRQSGKVLECEIASIDPVERHWYQHLEYSPLVNARAHRLGRDRKILNSRFYKQYHSFLEVLSYAPNLNETDTLGIAGYMFLQDRIAEGIYWLAKVKNAENVVSRLQYDYLTAYAALYREEPAQAAQIAEQYKNYGVDRWRERFALVADHVKEITGNEVDMTDGKDRENRQDALASKQPDFDITAEGKNVTIVYRNLREITINYYEMDLEFLFSSQPFVSADSGQFSYIRPNVSEKKALPDGQDTFQFELPERFHGKNVLVEVEGEGRNRSTAVYANDLRVTLTENYGRIEVRKSDDGSPLPKTYIKVYARFENGETAFFKDGYTDLRGKFDYASLNTDEIHWVDRFSILVMSGKNGAVVREAAPPKM